MTTEIDEPKAKMPVSTAALWFSALAGPLAWVFHNIVSYSLATTICIPGQVLLLHLLTAATALLALAAAIVGWRAYLRVHHAEWPDSSSTSKQRAYFMATFGLLSGLFFLVVILVEGIPNFYLDPCRTMV